MTDGLCEHLHWDSEFFGRRIARVTAPELTAETASEVVAAARADGVECLYFLASADHPPSLLAAQSVGFRLVDVRVTLERGLEGVDAGLPEGVASFASEDVAPITAIARTSHRDSRFYADPGFEDERCDDLYQTWIENSCNGFAEDVLVVHGKGGASGYISCHLNDDGSGQIGLIAVGEVARGRGQGGLLVRGSLGWFRERGCDRAVVVTQGRNVGALRLYERAGFLTRSVEIWCHLWPGAAG